MPKALEFSPYQLNSLDRFKLFKSRLTAFLLTVPDKPPVKGYASPSVSRWFAILVFGLDRSDTKVLSETRFLGKR